MEHFKEQKADNELLRNGSIKEFQILFKRYHLRLLNYANYMLNNRQEAEDLVQDVFINVWNNRENLYDEKKVAPFIFTILKNRCLNALKKRTIEQNYIAGKIKYPNEELYHISFEVENNFISLEEMLHKELNTIIEEMPERCATAFKLKWFGGKKIREIAEIMSISTTMVDKHLAKGLQIARKKLRPELFFFLLLTMGM